MNGMNEYVFIPVMRYENYAYKDIKKMMMKIDGICFKRILSCCIIKVLLNLLHQI